MNDFIAMHQSEFEDALNYLRTQFRGIRTGAANPALVENINVDMYGAMTPMKQVATITTSDSKTIMISPWDKGAIPAIEKAITNANIGVNPASNGDGVILNLPMLTEENRRDLAKIVSQKSEKSRIAGRNIRDKVKEGIIHAEKEKEITEDDRYRFVKDLDEYIAIFNDKIKKMAEDKEAEIMKI